MVEKQQATWAGFARWVADHYRSTRVNFDEVQQMKDRLVAASLYVDSERAAIAAIVAAGYVEEGVPQLRGIWLSELDRNDIMAPYSMETT